jgi:hypothetical protein
LTAPGLLISEVVAILGQTVVDEGGQLARYIGRVLRTIPDDAVGLVVGDRLHLVRTVIAAQYDVFLNNILQRHNVKETQTVGPSLAIPLVRAATTSAAQIFNSFGLS